MRNEFNSKDRGRIGFYVSLAGIILCVVIVALVYMNLNKGNNNRMDVTENGTLSMDEENNTVNEADQDSEAEPQKDTDVSQKVAETDGKAEDKKENTKTNSTEANNTENNVDGKKQDKKEAKDKKKEDEDEEAVSAMSNQNPASVFDEEAGLMWPVNKTADDIIMKYSMNNSIYFATLAQYRCNPAIVIACEKGSDVVSSADCTVTSINENDETGLTVTTSVGDNYTIKYGQLQNLQVAVGDRLKEGDTIGQIADPSKYYIVEGSNLYYQVLEGDKTIDPLLMLR